jgi:hypothetical protein
MMRVVQKHIEVVSLQSTCRLAFVICCTISLLDGSICTTYFNICKLCILCVGYNDMFRYLTIKSTFLHNINLLIYVIKTLCAYFRLLCLSTEDKITLACSVTYKCHFSLSDEFVLPRKWWGGGAASNLGLSDRAVPTGYKTCFVIFHEWWLCNGRKQWSFSV